MSPTKEQSRDLHNLSEPVAYTSRDESVVFSAFAEINDGRTTVRSTVDESDASASPKSASSKLTHGLELDSPLYSLLYAMTRGGEVDVLASTPLFGGAVEALGYIANVQSDVTVQGSRRTEITFSYPSLENLNRNVSQHLPSNGTSFVSFAGGEYTADDFVHGFAERGDILVARSIPYALHDHAGHVFGYVLQGERVMKAARTVIGAYIRRREFENELPSLEGLDESSMSPGLIKFLHPSDSILRAIVMRLDLLSNLTTDEIFTSTEFNFTCGDLEHKLISILTEFWESGNSTRVEKGLPKDFMKCVTKEEYAAMLEDITMRIRTLQAASGKT